MDISHPKLPNYEKNWTPKKIAETFVPSEQSHSTVKHWLEENGISGAKVSKSMGWIYANVTIAKAEDLLKTNYYLYEHDSGTKHVGCTGYSLHQDIREHNDFITPTIHFDFKVPVRANKLKRALEDENAASTGAKDIKETSPGKEKVLTVFKDLHLMLVGDFTTGAIPSDLSTCNTHCPRLPQSFMWIPCG